MYRIQIRFESVTDSADARTVDTGSYVSAPPEAPDDWAGILAAAIESLGLPEEVRDQVRDLI